MTIKISAKKNGTTTGSTKSLSITPKASPTSTPDQCIINVSLHAKNIGIVRHVEKNIVQRKTFPQTNLIENFTPHSCRSASTTKAFNMSLDIMDALGKVCWSNAK